MSELHAQFSHGSPVLRGSDSCHLDKQIIVLGEAPTLILLQWCEALKCLSSKTFNILKNIFICILIITSRESFRQTAVPKTSTVKKLFGFFTVKI
ncbi:Uncharacterised protein [Chlamydia trachomatis]|nr:Uncharacterised protein [Chlamydia trachomatis]